MNTFVQQGCVKLIKSDSKEGILLEKISYSSKNHEKKYHSPQHNCFQQW